MSEYIFKLPDLGEGTVEAEIVEWYVKPGDKVVEGQTIADVMTDKANVEVPAPVSGTVLRTSGEPGDVVAVGGELIAFTVDGGVSQSTRASTQQPPAVQVARPPAEPPAGIKPEPEPEPEPKADIAAGSAVSVQSTLRAKVMTSPAIRKRAAEADIDLANVKGTGPNGRILVHDFENYEKTADVNNEPVARAKQSAPPRGSVDTKVIGIRRMIAERLSQSKREIPHFAYVEEVDVTALEQLREQIQDTRQMRLSILPFIAFALLRTLPRFPQCNVHYIADGGLLRQFEGVHLGMAAQTPDGLKVPVITNADQLSFWQLAQAIADVAQRARDGEAKPSELTGSTITLTSLGKLGGVVSTPIINYPEVAIVGVNKVVKRAVVVDETVQIRSMMNLSSSFDHRFVDGFDAASMIQAVKQLLEAPATLFMPDPD